MCIPVVPEFYIDLIKHNVGEVVLKYREWYGSFIDNIIWKYMLSSYVHK